MDKLELIENFIDKRCSNSKFEHLKNEISWNDTLKNSISNEKVNIKRKMAYMFNLPVKYNYANLYFNSQLWTEQALKLKNKINEYCNHDFNSVLLNYYKNGKDEIKWHSDKEKELGSYAIIACINLGATRKFWFLSKETGVKDFVLVKDGDLLIMKAGFQEDYLHAILPEKQIKEPRISLTFRKVVYENIEDDSSTIS